MDVRSCNNCVYKELNILTEPCSSCGNMRNWKPENGFNDVLSSSLDRINGVSKLGIELNSLNALDPALRETLGKHSIIYKYLHHLYRAIILISEEEKDER